MTDEPSQRDRRERRIHFGGDTERQEFPPIAPVLIAGAARGLIAGAAGVATFTYSMLRGLAALDPWGRPGGVPVTVLLVAGVSGAFAGASFSAADAASRRTEQASAVRYAGAVLAPISALVAGVSFATVLQGRFGFQATLSTADLTALLFASPGILFLLGGAALAGPAEPGRGWLYALGRGLRFSAGPSAGVVLLFVFATLNERFPFKELLLTLGALSVATLVYASVHHLSRGVYRRVRSWLEPEPTG